ncbi:hypothetical protein GHC57_18665 [Roseospira navarrensis]|uniref:Uncharacterized protein n=2 Tax=Roseospira navarrensis TaxID=140058 RepID=A0A7X1ZJ40_9PROT|nr:hypothetical protein [Roseospira navarrensis]
MGDRGRAFADEVHRLLMTGRTTDLSDLAEAMNLSYHALYARVRGRTPFSAAEIRTLIARIPEADLVRYFTRGTDYLVLDRQDRGNADQPPSLQDGAVRTIIEATDILEAVHHALADGKLDHIDRGRIIQEVDACERALAGVRDLVERPADGTVRDDRPSSNESSKPKIKDRSA